MSRGYQHNYSDTCDSMHSFEDRQRKADTMHAVLREALGDRIGRADVLNLGCSTGIIDEYLADYVGSITGVDIDEPAINLAISRRNAPNVKFQIDDAMHLSFSEATFDVVICSQVYEHVPDAEQMMREISRVLRPGGVCYFAATNRWALIEKHHKLPFLSWLPGDAANRYVRLMRKGDAYYERHLGYQSLLSLVSSFKLEDFTEKIVATPDRYSAGYMFRGRLRSFVAREMLKRFPALFPGYVWLLWKRD